MKTCFNCREHFELDQGKEAHSAADGWVFFCYKCYDYKFIHGAYVCKGGRVSQNTSS